MLASMSRAIGSVGVNIGGVVLKKLIAGTGLARFEVFKAHRLLYQSTLGLRVIKKKKKKIFEVAPARVLSLYTSILGDI